MFKIHLFSSLILVALALSACAPAGSPVSPGQTEIAPSSTALSSPEASTPAAMTPTEAMAPSPLPLATSRGPELHATDPTTVSLASGGLQLVEFFRFT